MKKTVWLRFALALCLMVLTAFPAAIGEGAVAMFSYATGDETVLPLSEPAAQVTETAEAAGDPAPTEAVNVKLFSEPRAMRLPQNTTSFWFMLPQGTKLGDGSVLTLNYTTAGTLLEEYSSLTLIVNDVQIASTHLTANGANTGSWQVTIPAERLKTDGTLNELRIRSAQRSILGECADIDNPSNWIIFQDSSNLLLDVLEQGRLTLSNALPYFFNQPDYVNHTSAEFVLPTMPDRHTATAMMSIASSIGAQYAAKDTVNFTYSRGRAVTELRNRIFIGYGDGLAHSAPPIAGEFQYPALTQPSTGYLAVSRTGAFRNMLVAGSDPAGLAKASAFLTSNYVSQLSGNSAEIVSSPEVILNNFIKKDDGYYTLADFGYGNTSLEGAFHQETTYQLKQPESISSGVDSYVQIHFRHSKALLGDSSLLTVYINNVAISSIQLSASNADGGTIKAKIPAEALQSGTIEVKIECYNYLGKVDCSKDYYDTAWTVIDKASVIYFAPGSALILPTLQQFPVFDSQSSSEKAIAPTAIFSTSEKASDAMMQIAAALACRAGQNSGFASLWENVGSIEDSAVLETSDMIIMGSDEDIDIPAKLAENLYFVPRGKNMYSSSGAILTTAEVLRDKIILQVVRSPWNFSRKAYVVICPSGMEQQLEAFVAQRSLLNQLNAPVALIDGEGVVTNLTLAQGTAAAKVPFTPERALGQVVLKTGISRIGLLIIAVCVVLIIVLIFVVLSNRRRFVTAKQKMSEINAKSGKPQHDGDEDDFPEEDDDIFEPRDKK